jgi:hypothetical protein
MCECSQVTWNAHRESSNRWSPRDDLRGVFGDDLRRASEVRDRPVTHTRLPLYLIFGIPNLVIVTPDDDCGTADSATGGLDREAWPSREAEDELGRQRGS